MKPDRMAERQPAARPGLTPRQGSARTDRGERIETQGCPAARIEAKAAPSRRDREAVRRVKRPPRKTPATRQDIDALQTSLTHVDSIAQLRRCYEFRIGVEGETAYFAAQNRNADTLGDMRAALDRLEEAVALRNVGMDADFEFHLGVARATGNGFFATVMEAMRAPIEFGINLGRSLSLRRPKRHLERIQAEHVAIFKAIEIGDRDCARRTMRDHLTDACNRMFNGPDAGSLLTPSSIVQGGDDINMTFEGE